MVSYYNSLSYPQKHGAQNLSYPSAPHQAWFPTNYHPHHHHSTANQQFLTGMATADPTHINHQHHTHQAAAAAAMYYNSHMFHQTPSDLYAATNNFQNLSPATAAAVHLPPFHRHHLGQQGISPLIAHTGESIPEGSPLDETSSSADILTEGIPSPPITTISGGSGINSPGVPNATSSPHIHQVNPPIATSTPTINQISSNNNNNNNINHNDIQKRPTPTDSPYYDWMKKPTYPAQPNPGKTRTKDKYRVVYTDFQRLELEKEYHTSRYITIRRKTELAQGLQLSERQVKIWFQNRRAKERKQSKKRDDPPTTNSNQSTNTNMTTTQHVADELASFLDLKPKLDNADYSQHSFHPQLCTIGMGPPPPVMPSSLPYSVLHNHSHLGMPTSAPPVSQHSSVAASAAHMQQVYQQMMPNVVS